MTKKSHYIFVIFTCFVLAACGDVNFHGQAFFKDGEVTTKFSDLEIRVIEESLLLSEVDAFKKNAEIVYSTLLKKQKQLDDKNNELKTLRVTFNNLLEFEQWYKAVDSQILPDVKSKLGAADSFMKLANESLLKEIDSLKRGTHPAIFFVDKGRFTERTARTDADGKYSIKVNHPNGKLAIAKKDKYFWYLRLPEKDSEINLSNSNVYESSCQTCAFTGELNKDLRSKIGAYVVETLYAKSEDVNKKGENKASEKINEDLVTKSEMLIKKAKELAKKYSDLIVSEAIVRGLSGPGTADIQYDLKMRAINLQEGIIISRENHKKYSTELLMKVSALDPVLR